MSYMAIRVCIYVSVCAYVYRCVLGVEAPTPKHTKRTRVLGSRGHSVMLHRWVCYIIHGPQPASWGRNPHCWAEALITLSGSRGPRRPSAGSKRLRNEQMYFQNHKCLEADRGSSPFFYWESNLIHVISPVWGFISLLVKRED